ncbi:GNAT family N-acetyltransferase [Phocicoccus pinnipedialis]|uniref:N-acetyltransferase domain-containing protein n=1 Tax=Phocicoccus pinnipedialis TaxID=110845 RepID=A0A6V7R937_9BACL|nr:GNAT family N-acetyltransferase [Jeotgalicoccus pinnipedialis]MBP1938841.1 ribosomal protein S18 acetylase RimI-like enzyme [Jeotgalicoccus pinnipedialis]CAD2073332.1 hypothetical protein JEOPIN946_00703 [Jeotgalicoccus pinnipedialis]
MIRLARKEDKHQIAELIYIIWNDMELDIVRSLPRDTVLEVLALAIETVEYRNSYRHIYVYEVDGNVAGCIVGYPGAKEMTFENAWHDLDVTEEIKSFGTPLPEKEARNDEIYIESVATFPEYRGQGIASKLFKHLLNTDKNAKWGLICEKDNVGAQALYKRLGFKIDGETTLYGHDYHHMTYQINESVI